MFATIEARLTSIRDQADLLLELIEEHGYYEDHSPHDTAQLFCRIVHSGDVVIVEDERD